MGQFLDGQVALIETYLTFRSSWSFGRMPTIATLKIGTVECLDEFGFIYYSIHKYLFNSTVGILLLEAGYHTWGVDKGYVKQPSNWRFIALGSSASGICRRLGGCLSLRDPHGTIVSTWWTCHEMKTLDITRLCWDLGPPLFFAICGVDTWPAMSALDRFQVVRFGPPWFRSLELRSRHRSLLFRWIWPSWWAYSMAYSWYEATNTGLSPMKLGV